MKGMAVFIFLVRWILLICRPSFYNDRLPSSDGPSFWTSGSRHCFLRMFFREICYDIVDHVFSQQQFAAHSSRELLDRLHPAFTVSLLRSPSNVIV